MHSVWVHQNLLHKGTEKDREERLFSWPPTQAISPQYWLLAVHYSIRVPGVVPQSDSYYVPSFLPQARPVFYCLCLQYSKMGFSVLQVT